MQAKNYVIQVYLVCRYHSINDNSCITNMKFLETFLKYSEIVITGTSGGGVRRYFFLSCLLKEIMLWLWWLSWCHCVKYIYCTFYVYFSMYTVFRTAIVVWRPVLPVCVCTLQLWTGIHQAPGPQMVCSASVEWE